MTGAERLVTGVMEPPGAAPDPDMIWVPGSTVFVQPRYRVDLRNHYNWWSYVPAADWRHPRGPASTIRGLSKHPVVHVAWVDVEAYARWAAKELPTEAEWEFAARGGLDDTEYTWGDQLMPAGRYMANTWQGESPIVNEKLDGFEWTASVGSFPPNGYGLYDMAGNVWEWTTDWFQDHDKLEDVLHHLQPPGRRSGAEHRPEGAGAGDPDSAEGDEGRFAPLRAELLPAVPARGPHAAGH
jgi:sulfatase modifying factor 1